QGTARSIVSNVSIHRFFCIDVPLSKAIQSQKANKGYSLITELDRRKFLSRGFAALGATWTAAHWPAMVAAAEHAHRVALFPEDQKWEFFTPAEAKEVEALASCIIPSDGTPGAQIGRDTSELQSLRHLVCRLLLEKKK